MTHTQMIFKMPFTKYLAKIQLIADGGDLADHKWSPKNNNYTVYCNNCEGVYGSFDKLDIPMKSSAVCPLHDLTPEQIEQQKLEADTAVALEEQQLLANLQEKYQA